MLKNSNFHPGPHWQNIHLPGELTLAYSPIPRPPIAGGEGFAVPSPITHSRSRHFDYASLTGLSVYSVGNRKYD